MHPGDLRIEAVVAVVTAGAVSDDTRSSTVEARDGVRRPPRRNLRRSVTAALVIVIALIVAALVHDQIQADHRYDRSRQSLEVTRHQLALVRADLGRVRRDLAAVDGQIGVDDKTLAQDTAQLQGLETALASAGETVSSQHATVDDLQVCLTGVEQGLNALAVGDQVHALAALRVVSGACNSVSAADG